MKPRLRLFHSSEPFFSMPGFPESRKVEILLAEVASLESQLAVERNLIAEIRKEVYHTRAEVVDRIYSNDVNYIKAQGFNVISRLIDTPSSSDRRSTDG